MSRPTHACAVPDCGQQIPMGHLMCGPHWRRVPQTTATAVTAAWRRYKALPTIERARTLSAVQLVAVQKVLRGLAHG